MKFTTHKYKYHQQGDGIMNFLKGYRTVIFNIALFVASLVEIVGVVDTLAPGASASIILAVSIANLVLRYMTDTTVGTSTQHETL